MAETETDEKTPIEPTTEFDGMEVGKIPNIDRSKWMAITNMIFHHGKKEGWAEGYKAGKEAYSLAWRFLWNSGTFIMGGLLGMTIGSAIMILMLRNAGWIIGGK